MNINPDSHLLQGGVIFMEDHIPQRPDRSLLIGRQTSKESGTVFFWNVWQHLMIRYRGFGLILWRLSL